MSITLIIGGVSSGKSNYAERLASERAGDSVLYVATGQGGDEEMKLRIERHQAQRPQQWLTCEAPLDLPGALVERTAPRLFLLETLSGWIANILFSYSDQEWGKPHVQETILERVENLLLYMKQHQEKEWIIVSDEAGLGGVMPNPLGRAFQQCVGLANQKVAAQATEVIMVVAGLPLIVKENNGDNLR